jgi:glycosyltransferase involved in cell wall biosynthesis
VTGPCVAIGLPTYNRPEGLARALSCLVAQAHTNLRILVSDNCSTSGDTEAVARDFERRDSRVRFVRQACNIGAIENFRYVLRESEGEYFMWAADDDEWAPEFVSSCVAAMRPGLASVMTAFETHYRYHDRRVLARMPDLAPERGAASNLASFLVRPTPSLFYGLHRRAAVLRILTDEMFDYYDCFLVMHLIVSGGIALVPRVLYSAGVDAPHYQVKPVSPSWGSGLRFLPFYRAGRNLLRHGDFSAIERLRLEATLAYIVARLAVAAEGRALLGKWRGAPG